MKIFIMAQGKGSRWKENARFPVPCEIKQHVPILGTPLIQRTVNQVRGVPSVSIVGKGEWFGNFHRNTMTLTEPTGSILNGIIKTSLCWFEDKDILFLLGDVVYSEYAISLILSNLYLTPPITLYGRLTGNLFTGKSAKEIFAVHIRPETSVFDILDEGIRRKEDNAKLWDVYNITQKIVPVADWTDDIDSPEEYNLFYKKIEEFARRNG